MAFRKIETSLASGEGAGTETKANGPPFAVSWYCSTNVSHELVDENRVCDFAVAGVVISRSATVSWAV